MKLKCLSFVLTDPCRMQYAGVKTGKSLSYHFDARRDMGRDAFPLG